jgi:hypothetical protein
MAVIVAAVAAAAGAATHDLEVTLTSNAVQGRIPAGTINLKITIKNKGPEKVAYEEGLTFTITKFDHTGQQYLKQVATRVLPLLDPPGGSVNSMSFDYTDSSTAGTFYYKAGLGPGYYTDSNNTNHRPQFAVIFYAPAATQLRWSARLTPADFTRAGATLTQQQIDKLNANTYTLESIVTSGTDRLTDSQRCNSCHTGQPGQQPAKYRPTVPISMTNAHRVNATDTNPTASYTWAEAGSSGVIAKFLASSYSKPQPLEKIFHQWLLDGRRP